MASAARELEPDPLPSDLSKKAPIISDVERGYVKDETPYEEIDLNTRNQKAGSNGTPVTGDGLEHVGDRPKKEKTKGKGLTEGDDGEH